MVVDFTLKISISTAVGVEIFNAKSTTRTFSNSLDFQLRTESRSVQWKFVSCGSVGG